MITLKMYDIVADALLYQSCSIDYHKEEKETIITLENETNDVEN